MIYSLPLKIWVVNGPQYEFLHHAFKTNKNRLILLQISRFLVRVGRFELPASWTQSYHFEITGKLEQFELVSNYYLAFLAEKGNPKKKKFLWLWSNKWKHRVVIGDTRKDSCCGVFICRCYRQWSVILVFSKTSLHIKSLQFTTSSYRMHFRKYIVK